MNHTEVVLVDTNDKPLGTMEKMEAHRKALLHRAFSVFVFNSNNELMLQQRALHKYHSGGLWTNTCCSHPFPDEDKEQAAHRRLKEEMGFDCDLQHAYHFVYRAELDHGLTEHELDHVFFGRSNETPVLNPEEVAAFRYISMDELAQEIAQQPEQFTEWFKIIFDTVKHNWKQYLPPHT